VTRRIRRRGEHEISRKTIARGMPVDPSEPVVTMLVRNSGSSRRETAESYVFFAV
jgi:hypothetical protein